MNVPSNLLQIEAIYWTLRRQTYNQYIWDSSNKSKKNSKGKLNWRKKYSKRTIKN